MTPCEPGESLDVSVWKVWTDRDAGAGERGHLLSWREHLGKTITYFSKENERYRRLKGIAPQRVISSSKNLV